MDRPEDQVIRLQGFLDSLPFYALVVDEDHKIIAANAAVTEALGQPPESIIGGWCPKVIHGLDHPYPGCPLEEAVDSGDSAKEVEYRDPESGRWYASAVYLMDERLDGRRLYSHMVHDITARMEAEERLREHLDSLEATVVERTAAANQANEAKSQFLATMSHELRTPLNSIIGFSGILLSGVPGDLNEEQQRQLDMVSSSAKRLLSLVNDILDLSKIEAGELELEVGSFTLGDAVSLASELLTFMGEQKGLDVEIANANPQAHLRTDLRAIEQILTNLASNAVKSTVSGSVCLGASLIDNGLALFEVRDTGVGIPEEDLEAVFEPFYQTGRAVGAGRAEGTGLGLAICRRLAARLGGSLSVQSKLGEGSTFSLEIPVEIDGSG